MQRTIKIFLVVVLAGLATGMLSCKKDAGTGHNPGSPIKVDSFTATSGGVGTEVLISGSNFSSDTSQIKVFVNGHQLALVGANARQIMAVIPAKCGSGHVIVKIGGDTAVSAGVFNYTFSRVVSTLAGNGTAGFANGQGTDAQFNFGGEIWYRSQGIVVDDDLNVYVADPGNHCIRKIDSLGNVTTLAGDPTTSGNMDGQGAAAQFSIPYDLAIDVADNLYTVDPGTWSLRKISPDGLVTTMGGTSQEPWTVAIDPTSGSIYYSSCSGSGNVYRMDADGSSHEVISAQNYSSGIKFDKTGNLYIASNGDQVIYKFDAGTWNKTVVAGTMGSAGYVNGAGTAAKFAYPWGLAIDGDGNLLLGENGTWNGDTGNPDQSIRYIAADTRDVSTFAGSNSAGFADGIGEAASFSAPIGVAVDKNGTVYVLDKNNNRVRKIISL